MKKPAKHIFVCASFRMSGSPQGACAKKGAGSLLQHLETELGDRGMTDVSVSMTGCLNLCDKGPVMVVYPEGAWYGNVTTGTIDAMLDAWENGTSDAAYRLN